MPPHPYEFGGRPARPGDAVIVTGAATGLGLDIALRLAADGLRTFATVRDEEQAAELRALAAQRGAQLEVLLLDLADLDSIESAVAAVAAQAGGIYGLVNNGGLGLRGALEDCSPGEIRRLYEVNLVGTALVTRAVLPYMREAGCGRVVTISSIGGRVPGAHLATYCSSKFAQEGFAECLALELAPFGVQSLLIEPGMVKTTRWGEFRGTAAGAEDPSSPYHAQFWDGERVADGIVNRSRTTPEDVAAAVSQVLVDPAPKMRTVIGNGAKLVIALRRFLPQKRFEKLYYGSAIRRQQRKLAKAGPPTPPAPPPAASPPQELVP